VITERTAPDAFREPRERAHPDCVVCSAPNAHGLCLDFTLLDDGSVSASFDCSKAFAGYDGCIHGGVIASLLDGAMTNCLFAHGHVAMTAELNVRYPSLLATGTAATVRAWIERTRGPLHVLKAEVMQAGMTKATASGKFMPQRLLKK